MRPWSLVSLSRPSTRIFFMEPSPAADAGSDYDPSPFLTYAWDPVRTSQLTRSKSRVRSGHGLSVDLGPHPADPHSTSLPDYDSIPSGPNVITKHSNGQELYVYVGHSG